MTSYVEALASVAAERERQLRKWGVQHHPDGTGGIGTHQDADMQRALCERRFEIGQGTWRDILLEEVFEAMAEKDPATLREELIHVAAVAVGWIEDIESREAT